MPIRSTDSSWRLSTMQGIVRKVRSSVQQQCGRRDIFPCRDILFLADPSTSVPCCLNCEISANLPRRQDERRRGNQMRGGYRVWYRVCDAKEFQLLRDCSESGFALLGWSCCETLTNYADIREPRDVCALILYGVVGPEYYGRVFDANACLRGT